MLTVAQDSQLNTQRPRKSRKLATLAVAQEMSQLGAGESPRVVSGRSGTVDPARRRPVYGYYSSVALYLPGTVLDHATGQLAK
jgi:hypothetical protein